MKGCFLSTDVFSKDRPGTVKIYLNNKPYITRDIKECINRKKSTFKLSDTEGVRTAHKELNQHMRAARLQYKEPADQDLSTHNSKKLWDSMGFNERNDKHGGKKEAPVCSG